MFTVVRPEIFLSIPVDSHNTAIYVSYENEQATIEMIKAGNGVAKSLTLTEVCDLIDALEEVKRRME